MDGEGWFYKQNGKRLGPVSRLQLRELVASGQVPHRQAVWTESTYGLVFVCAANVAFGTENEALDRQGHEEQLQIEPSHGSRTNFGQR
jgi:GYF domain 2